MIFLNKKFKIKLFKQPNLLYSIKLYNDFIFFSYLIKEYIKIYTNFSIYIIKNFIYLLNILAVKYIIYYSNNKYIFNNIYHTIYILELISWKKELIFKFNKKYNYSIEQKILLIKKISKTRAKGRINKYKVILILGNKTGWFGIGYSKHFYLQEAISNARLHAFKNIYHFPLFYSNKITNNIYIEKKIKKLYLFSSIRKIHMSRHYVIRVLFNFIGYDIIYSKLIKLNNIYNILSLILNL
uniref:Ribosomal protein S5 n=1 Tax=Cyclospora cayetanensis TaxID=88456 RepID=A0A0K0NTZ4_9EIME|nr:ribosomal protein S5 [Cyclospora cayetanensis]AKO71983.1 ribosomal protein S5 [Cyclospora cayetanensis]ANJ44338.1 ribosomal protein S5 [Cyclospora cayetanensis]ANN13272.1 ribosomal protein S5 [Cyclospora cayetanensis]ANN13301.1 ribosomal protein S5 [Cyclospora cayetanensis]ANN13330.1 ribosomal protein S5 [Cyclospora cayetanensis]